LCLCNGIQAYVFLFLFLFFLFVLITNMIMWYIMVIVSYVLTSVSYVSRVTKGYANG